MAQTQDAEARIARALDIIESIPQDPQNFRLLREAMNVLAGRESGGLDYARLARERALA